MRFWWLQGECYNHYTYMISSSALSSMCTCSCSWLTWICRMLGQTTLRHIQCISPWSICPVTHEICWLGITAERENPKRLDKDLRLISLIPLISKIQKCFVVKWIWDNVCVDVDSTQYGCKRGSSTVHALVELYHHLSMAIYDCRLKQDVRILLLDFRKTFAHIDHTILITKLRPIDHLPEFLVAWIAAFIHRQTSVCKDRAAGIWLDVHYLRSYFSP